MALAYPFRLRIVDKRATDLDAEAAAEIPLGIIFGGIMNPCPILPPA
jgi:hypothetical protein